MARRNIYKIVILVLVALCFFAGTKLIYSNVVYAWNKSQLKDLAARSIIRAEYATDLAVTTMVDIQIQDLTKCTKKTMEAYRRYILSAGNIKNISLRTAGSNCSGFNAEDVQKYQDSDKYWISGGASNIHFFVLPNKKKGMLGIKWEQDDYDLIATVSAGGLLYDMVPSKLRTHLEIKILLDNGKEISSYQPDVDTKVGKDKIEPADQLIYKASSDRYPIKAYLKLDRAALSALGGKHGKVFDLSVGLIGLIIGFLVSRVLFPPLGIIGELDGAISNREFHPHYQPIVSLHSHRIVGFEMLARWTKPNGKMIPAGYFIPLAENLGKVDAILFSLLRSAGKEIRRELHNNPKLKLTFNITPRQFLDPTFLKRLLNVITKADLPICNLVAEITERQQLEDLEQAAKLVTLYGEMGIRIAIDDVGTGHNGLSSIQKLDANTMKIDKLFIDGIVHDEKSRQMVAMLSQLAREYQMITVAEGIETAEQAALALALGIQEGQGYYFFHPVPADKLVEILKSEQRVHQLDIKPLSEGITEEFLGNYSSPNSGNSRADFRIL